MMTEIELYDSDDDEINPFINTSHTPIDIVTNNHMLLFNNNYFIVII